MVRDFQKLNLCDDFIFKEVMADKSLVIGFLEMVLDIKGKIKDIKYVEREKTIRSRYLNKSIRLDVYVVDEENNLYNIEIQNGKFKNLPKRSRKYQSNMDADALKPGEDYDNLKKQYIIFVCTGDPFGLGLYKYTFSNKCHENPSLDLGDEVTKIFLNTRGKYGEVSKELKAFLNFVEMSTVANAEKQKDLYVKKLSEKIEDIKRDEELGGIFMTLEEKMNELAAEKLKEGLERGIKQGIEQGIEQGIVQGIEQGIVQGIEQGIEKGLAEGKKRGAEENSKEIARTMKVEGFDIEQIARLTKLTKDEINRL